MTDSYSDSDGSLNSDSYSEYDSETDFEIEFEYIEEITDILSDTIRTEIYNIVNSSYFLKNINKLDKYSLELMCKYVPMDIDLYYWDIFGIHTQQYSSRNVRLYLNKYPLYYDEDMINNNIYNGSIFLNDAIRTIFLYRRGIQTELIPIILDMIRPTNH